MKPADGEPVLPHGKCENRLISVTHALAHAGFSRSIGNGKNVSIRHKLSVKLLHAVPTQTVPFPVAHDSLL